MARPKRTNRRDREAHLMEVARLYLLGTPVTEIARQRGVTHPAITRDLHLLTARWIKEQGIDMDKKKVIEIERLNHLEGELWKAWNRSKGDHIIVAEDSHVEKDGNQVVNRIRRVRETSAGTVAILGQILRVIEVRARIMGLMLPATLVQPEINVQVEDRRVMGIYTPDQAPSLQATEGKITKALNSLPPNERTQIIDMFQTLMELHDDIERRLAPALTALSAPMEQGLTQ